MDDSAAESTHLDLHEDSALIETSLDPRTAGMPRHRLVALGLALAAAVAVEAFLAPRLPTTRQHAHHLQPGSRAPRASTTALQATRGNDDAPAKQKQRAGLRLPTPLAGLALLALNFVMPSRPVAALPQTAPETNPQKMLIDALPNKNPVLVDMAGSLARITTEGSGNIRSVDAKGFKGIKPWPEVVKAQRAASGLLAGRSKDLLVGVKDEKAAQAALDQLKQSVEELGAAAEAQDRGAAVQAQVKALKALDKLGTLEVKGFPFQVPDEYQGLPQLLGRAEVALTVKAGKTGKSSEMRAVLDGFSAPVTAGNFLDLVNKGAFNNVPVVDVDESSVTFSANGKGAGRKVPLEVLAVGDKEPTYGETLEEQGRYKARVVLPFAAFGALAQSHPGDDPNGGGSTFFFLKFDPSYTPAGLNTLDGAYSVIGYVVEGSDALDDLAKGDPIQSASVVSGLEYLKQP